MEWKQREYEFRAYNTETKKMYYLKDNDDFELGFGYDGWFLREIDRYEGCHDYPVEQENGILTQYIDKLDEDGDKIFGGDIIKSGDDLYVVKYGEDSCGCCKLVYGYEIDWENVGGKGKIVGNVFENPELLD